MAMKASRDKMCNCALAAVNKLNEVSYLYLHVCCFNLFVPLTSSFLDT